MKKYFPHLSENFQIMKTEESTWNLGGIDRYIHGLNSEERHEFHQQFFALRSTYPGGFKRYIENAKKLLASSKQGNSPYDGFSAASVPLREDLTFGSENFIEMEKRGVLEAKYSIFVLVAGGLGERLGYKGTKVALPRETTTWTCFLQYYIESILALQEASNSGVLSALQEASNSEKLVRIPFVIMTSNETHGRILSLLKSNSYFGMSPTQVILLRQGDVACLEDNDGRFVLDEEKKILQAKPHGHGDVHHELFLSNLIEKWLEAGYKWILFFQDTNGLVFNAIPASLGVSATKEYHVNFLAVPRKAKEAVGGIAQLSHSDGRSMVVNVEYDELDRLLRASGFHDGDANCETGYSPFPGGDCNQFILKLGSYKHVLDRCDGTIGEFSFNPKYKDSTETAFEYPTRLECRMQDFGPFLSQDDRVGVTVMDKWLTYAPVKNGPTQVVPEGNPYHSATSGEMAIYRANSLILQKAGVRVGEPQKRVFNGEEVEVWSRIVWQPKWGMIFSDIKEKVTGNCEVSQKSTMAIRGRNVFINDLSLDGALIVDSTDDAEVKLEGLIKNNGWTMESVDLEGTSVPVPEEIRIRGFKFNKVEQLNL